MGKLMLQILYVKQIETGLNSITLELKKVWDNKHSTLLFKNFEWAEWPDPANILKIKNLSHLNNDWDNSFLESGSQTHGCTIWQSEIAGKQTKLIS